MYLWIEKDSENPDFIAILCFTKVYDIFFNNVDISIYCQLFLCYLKDAVL